MTNTCEKVVCGISNEAFRLGQETLRDFSELNNKHIEHRIQSPVQKFKMLAVWPYIAEGFPTIHSQVNIY